MLPLHGCVCFTLISNRLYVHLGKNYGVCSASRIHWHRSVLLVCVGYVDESCDGWQSPTSIPLPNARIDAPDVSRDSALQLVTGRSRASSCGSSIFSHEIRQPSEPKLESPSTAWMTSTKPKRTNSSHANIDKRNDTFDARGNSSRRNSLPGFKKTYGKIGSATSSSQKCIYKGARDSAQRKSSSQLAPLTSRDCEAIVDSRLDRVRREDLDITRAAFCLCIGGEGIITNREMIEALALSEDPQIDAEMDEKGVIRECEKKILEISGGLIGFDENDRVRFVHPTVKKYITSGNSAYSVSHGDAHEYLSITSWTYNCYGNIDRDLQSESEPRRSIARYFLEHCITHSHLAEAQGKSLAVLLLQLMKSDPEAFRNWGRKYSEIRGIQIRDEELTQPLLFAAKFGFRDMARRVVEDSRISSN